MSLTVVVCVKQVLFAGLPLVRAEEGHLDFKEESQPVYVLNPGDLSALELAICLKENAAASVKALTLGPDRAQEVLRICLARGADAATHLICPEETQWDAWQLTGLVARGLHERRPDLVLCSDESLDDAWSAFGPFLAERLGWPQVTRAENLELQQEGRILVRRRLEHGDREVLACPLPAVVSVCPFAKEAQYVSLSRVMMIPPQRIERLPANCEEPPLSQLRRIEVRTPRSRPRRVSMPAANLRAAERISFLMSGGRVGSDGDLFEGTPHQAAEKIFEFLKERGFV
jgi:electron transfer flavoprotein alpha/beta subunit